MGIDISAYGKDQDGNNIKVADAMSIINNDDWIVLEATGGKTFYKLHAGKKYKQVEGGKTFYKLLNDKILKDTTDDLKDLIRNIDVTVDEGRGEYLITVLEELVQYTYKYPTSRWNVC